MKKISILITDDHQLIRQAWCVILNADARFKVVAEAGTGEAAVELAAHLRPNIATVDINLPGINGIETTKLIRKVSPGTKILGVSMHVQQAYVRQLMKVGAMGYVTKNSSSEEMCKAIMEIQNNRKYICDEIKGNLFDEGLGDNKPGGFNALSTREIEIIGLLKKGHSSKDIAIPLGITVKTVEAHRYNILKKLKLKNTVAMIDHINNSQLFL